MYTSHIKPVNNFGAEGVLHLHQDARLDATIAAKQGFQSQAVGDLKTIIASLIFGSVNIRFINNNMNDNQNMFTHDIFG